LSGCFDFNEYTVVCNFCGHKINQWSLKNIIAAWYWLGSPKDLNYLYDQNLFKQYSGTFFKGDSPELLRSLFLKTLGDFSQTKGKVSS